MSSTNNEKQSTRTRKDRTPPRGLLISSPISENLKCVVLSEREAVVQTGASKFLANRRQTLKVPSPMGRYRENCLKLYLESGPEWVARNARRPISRPSV